MSSDYFGHVRKIKQGERNRKCKGPVTRMSLAQGQCGRGSTKVRVREGGTGQLARWAVGHHQAIQDPIDWGTYNPVHANFSGVVMAPSSLSQGKKHSGWMT